jgi:hypothetical protein
MSNGIGIEGGWVANLSDGTTVYESPPVEGERTPWQQLLQRCREEWHAAKKGGKETAVPLRITGLSLQYGNVIVGAMPQKMCDGYFQAREIHSTIITGRIAHRHGIGSIVNEEVFITWVEFHNGQLFIKSEVRTLDACKVHSSID